LSFFHPVAFFDVDGGDGDRPLRICSDVDVIARFNLTRGGHNSRQIGLGHPARLNSHDATLAELDAGKHSAGNEHQQSQQDNDLPFFLQTVSSPRSD
jgi:hypothetical protein